MRPVRRADNSAAQVVPNIKVGMDAQNSISRLNPRDLLRKALPFI